MAELKQPADADPETPPLDFTHHQIQLRRITPHTTICRNITRDLAHNPKSPIIRYIPSHIYMNVEKWPKTKKNGTTSI